MASQFFPTAQLIINTSCENSGATSLDVGGASQTLDKAEMRAQKVRLWLEPKGNDPIPPTWYNQRHQDGPGKESAYSIFYAWCDSDAYAGLAGNTNYSRVGCFYADSNEVQDLYRNAIRNPWLTEDPFPKPQ